MAVRQYVGARYVPKFYQNSTDPSGTEWEGNRSYEALTVVSYNNDSYTSKIPVPAGIGNPASNPTYWARTGAYNAQVEQYRQEVVKSVEDVNTNLQNAQTKLEGDMQTLKADTVEYVNTNLQNAQTKLEGDMQTLKADTVKSVEDVNTNLQNAQTKLEGDMQTLKADTEQSIQQVQEQANEIQNNLATETTERKNNIHNLEKRYLLIGDSYAVMSPSWTDTWATVLKANLNAEVCDIYSNGGAGFNLPGNQFISLLNQAPEDADYTDIVVCGGANDIFHNSGLTSAIQTFVSRAIERYPKCTVHIGFIGIVKNSYLLANNSSPAQTAICISNYHHDFPRTTYLTGVEYVLNGTADLIDQTHPNNSTNIKLGRAIYQALTQGYYSNCAGNTSIDLTGVDGKDYTLTVYINNNNMTIYAPPTFTLPAWPTTGGIIRLATVKDITPIQPFLGLAMPATFLLHRGPGYATVNTSCLITQASDVDTGFEFSVNIPQARIDDLVSLTGDVSVEFQSGNIFCGDIKLI